MDLHKRMVIPHDRRGKSSHTTKEERVLAQVPRLRIMTLLQRLQLTATSLMLPQVMVIAAYERRISG